MAEYEAVKKQESERRAAYKNEKNELEQEIAQLEARLQAPVEIDAGESERLKQIEEQHQLVTDRLQQQRLILVS